MGAEVGEEVLAAMSCRGLAGGPHRRLLEGLVWVTFHPRHLGCLQPCPGLPTPLGNRWLVGWEN